MLRSDLCDYSDSCIVVKGRISVTGTNSANTRSKKLTFKINAPCRPCISKIINTFIDIVEDLDIVMTMSESSTFVIIILWHREVSGIIIEMKWMMMQTKIMMLVIIKQIIARQQQVNIFNIRKINWKHTR